MIGIFDRANFDLSVYMWNDILKQLNLYMKRFVKTNKNPWKSYNY